MNTQTQTAVAIPAAAQPTRRQRGRSQCDCHSAASTRRSLPPGLTTIDQMASRIDQAAAMTADPIATTHGGSGRVARLFTR